MIKVPAKKMLVCGVLGAPKDVKFLGSIPLQLNDSKHVVIVCLHITWYFCDIQYSTGDFAGFPGCSGVVEIWIQYI